MEKQKINQLLIDLGFDDVEVTGDMDKKQLENFLYEMGFASKEVKEIISEFKWKWKNKKNHHTEKENQI